MDHPFCKKYLSLLFISCVSAVAQSRSGSVVVYLVSPSEITVAAESRATSTATRNHTDSCCKIRAFGGHFFVAVAGLIQSNDWSSPEIARGIWEAKNKKFPSSEELTNQVARSWVSAMSGHLKNPGEVLQARHYLEGMELTYALFGATDDVGGLSATRATIAIDLPLYDEKKIVRLVPTIERLQLETGGTLGLGEVANEFYTKSSKRAEQFMSSYLPTIALLPPRSRYAELARKLIELSIELHPKRQSLGGPIDELQLLQGQGVHWISLKPGCASN